MKQQVFAAVASAFFSCASVKTRDVARPENSTEVLQMLQDFEGAVSRHDKNKIVELLDGEYKEKEFERLYQKNKDTFLNDFFCGQVVGQDQFHCLVFDEITGLERMGVEGSGDSVIVQYFVKSSAREIRTRLKINVKKTVTYGILGSRGITQVE